MNNIGLIISGNLTGFIRFYASANIGTVPNASDFDFDYRNYLTFLRDKDKAYAIAFSSGTIAISLVTRILDSFRRPGVLVVSVLLPRDTQIVSKVNPQDNKAIYKLLIKVDELFHEHNFLNGMLNQTPAVLMQDYYSDILAQYELKSVRQRAVSMMVNPGVANKKAGYVKTDEQNVPLFLQTPCRASYDGYNCIFFANSPVENIINEEPEELVVYSVFVSNTKQRISSVTLNDKIVQVMPEHGQKEKTTNTDLTYRQVLAGEGKPGISAQISSDNVITLTYSFAEEEKSVKLIFSDGEKNIPLMALQPFVIYDDGKQYSISSETFSFFGKEIYEHKIVKLGNSKYCVREGSQDLDISRIHDGQEMIIYVKKSNPYTITFSGRGVYPKRITLRRNGKVFISQNVTDKFTTDIVGDINEYTYVITSNDYETEEGRLPASGEIPLRMKPKSEHRAKTRNNSVATTDNNIHTGEAVASFPTVREENKQQKKHNTNQHIGKKRNKMVILIALPIFVFTLILVSINLSGVFKGSEEKPDVSSVEPISINAQLSIVDTNRPQKVGEEPSHDPVKWSELRDLLALDVNDTDSKKILLEESSDSASRAISFITEDRKVDDQSNTFTHEVKSENPQEVISVTLYLRPKNNLQGKIQLAHVQKSYAELKNDPTIKIQIPIPFSVLKDYANNGKISEASKKKLEGLTVSKDLLAIFEPIKYVEITGEGSNDNGTKKGQHKGEEGKGLKGNLPPDIEERVHRAKTLSKSQLNTYDIDGVLKGYDDWISSLKEKEKEKDDDVIDGLKQCVTYNQLKIFVNKQKLSNKN